MIISSSLTRYCLVAVKKRSIAEQVPTRVTDKSLKLQAPVASGQYVVVRSVAGILLSGLGFNCVQISKSLSSVAALVCPITRARMSYHSVRSSQTASVVSPSKFNLVTDISAQLSCSARMSYHSVRSSQTGPRSVVSPSKFQLVLQISKSLSSVAALVCPITRYVQVRLALEA
ncbi:hypothetical protein J6590_018385 [Homalodisca vitripennis]|nr:hypothetical protein J6590_018385 [Homalodisca vitripennis]